MTSKIKTTSKWISINKIQQDGILVSDLIEQQKAESSVLIEDTFLSSFNNNSVFL